MKQDFLELISILLKQQPDCLVADNQQQFHFLSQRFNDVLGVTNRSEMFNTELFYEGEKYLIPPVPFASTNEQNQPITFAFFGLNPKLDLGNYSTIQEKRYAGDTWDQYSTFYTTINRNEHDIGSFYRNLTILMESLKHKRLVRWSAEFARGLNREEKLEKFIKSVEKDPLLVGELIPFHSSSSGALDEQKIRTLLLEIIEYREYLTALFTIIRNKLDNNGWLIGNGKGASAALKLFIEDKVLEGNFIEIHDIKSEKYTCYIWEYEGMYRKVILLHEFLRRKGGELNSYEQIEEMLINVIEAFDKWEKVVIE